MYMELLNVNPTRTELLNLKRRLGLARRGHKLLSEKRDQLMRRFSLLLAEWKEKRKAVDGKLADSFRSLAVARALSDTGTIESRMGVPSINTDVSVEYSHAMNVRMPSYSIGKTDFRRTYGYFGTPGELDRAAFGFAGVMPDVAVLATLEMQIKLLAGEIERTRRRVNVLEHLLIPSLEQAAVRIEMKIEEMEREGYCALMKVKDILEQAG